MGRNDVSPEGGPVISPSMETNEGETKWVANQRGVEIIPPSLSALLDLERL